MYQLLKEVNEFRKHEISDFDKLTKSVKASQGSIVAYSFGFKLAKMAEQLQEITFNETSDVGKIKFDKGEYFGSTLIKDFHNSERNYFYGLLDDVTPLIDKFYPDRKDEFLEKFESILESVTFKESRKPQYIRLVPDRIDSINLRIYNKSEFVTDYFLKQLEKLDDDIEHIAREKYFQGISGGLDYTLINRFERLKNDDADEFRSTSEILEEAKQEYRDSKERFHSHLGSFYEKDKEKVFKRQETEKSLTMREITDRWMENQSPNVKLPEISTQKQDVIDKKGIAISSVEPAKYTKEHCAAALYFFVNFTMSEIKREELLEANLLSDPLDFEGVIESLTTAFKKNYQNYEKTHKLPEFLKGPSDLEVMYKYDENQK